MTGVYSETRDRKRRRGGRGSAESFNNGTASKASAGNNVQQQEITTGNFHPTQRPNNPLHPTDQHRQSTRHRGQKRPQYSTVGYHNLISVTKFWLAWHNLVGLPTQRFNVPRAMHVNPASRCWGLPERSKRSILNLRRLGRKHNHRRDS